MLTKRARISGKKLRSLVKLVLMKNMRLVITMACFSLLLASCSVFKKGEGCPTNGKNVGAEKLLDGSKTKAKKFKA
jgi:hypothetical protein